MTDHHNDESIARSQALKERVVALCQMRSDRPPHQPQRAYAYALNAFHRAEDDLYQRSRSLPWSTDRRVANAIYTQWFEDSAKDRWWRVLREEQRRLLRWAVEEMQRGGLGDASETALLQRAASGRDEGDEVLQALCMALEI